MFKKLLLFLVILIVNSNLFATNYTGGQANALVEGADFIIVDNKTENIKFIRLDPNHQIEAQASITWLRKVLLVPTDVQLNLKSTELDQIGITHVKYYFTIHGITIEDAAYTFHYKNGSLISVSGEFDPKVELNQKLPSLTDFQVENLAKKSIKNDTKNWDNEVTENPTLVCIKENTNYTLAYKVDVYSTSPLIRRYVYVNATSGNIITERNRIHHTDVTGTAVTKYNGTRTITTDSISSNSFRLRETGRGNGINTYDLNTSTFYSNTDFVDSDNYWNVTTNQDDAAYDAHFGAEATYDYFFNTFSRNSYDNLGATINSYVHYGSNFVNAFWDGTRMTYGDGDGVNATALTSIDVVGHEITHAVTTNTANLVYSYESGALNESFSDIFGIAIDFYKNPTTATYLMGDQFAINTAYIRSMSNPKAYGQPDTYLGTSWYTGSLDNGGVHTNSGVQNYWFYLLANGGTGTNDNGNSYNVTGIGLTAAAAIAYRNLNVYLGVNSQYTDARSFSIQSAIDLYGSCSAEVIATTNAWHAAGVGASYSSSVIAAFSANNTFSCSTPATIAFTNQSTNGSTYFWNFGDGTTSTATSPTHTYTSSGTYTVSLIVNGSATCNSNDTLVQSNYITVSGTGGPVTTTCSPSTSSAGSFGMGIFNLTLNTINNSSLGGSAGYEDFTCTNTTGITEGGRHSIGITTGVNYTENVKVWIDYDNNGSFNNTNELVFTSNNVSANHSGTIIVPGGVVLNQPLRLRVISDFSSNTINSACTNPTYGQAEDYTVTIQPNTNPPIADFVGNQTVVNVGQSVSFSDLSANAPTSWNWSFPGGVPSSSTIANPSITYNTLGNWPVSLVTTNSFGTDSITKNNYINVSSTVNLCSTTSTNSTSGILYDSGGPTGNYPNNQNCSFLIAPGCATSVTLSFNSFLLESCCDYFNVYDGTNTSGTLLLSANGSTIPSPVTANSGSMYITFTSDGSVTYSGWEATWSAQVAGVAPVADFSVSDPRPPVNTEVSFTDLTTVFPTQWYWDFGDGNTSVLQNPKHTYSNPGNYSVNLISQNCSASDTISYNVAVQAFPNISLSDDSLNITLNCGSSDSTYYTIYNNSGGDLVFENKINNSNGSTNSSSGLRILSLTYGVDFSWEYPNTLAAISRDVTNYSLTEVNTTSPTILSDSLINKDVLLMPEVENGVVSVFTNLASTIQNFANNGGTVIFLGSYGTYANSIFNTGLFSGNSITFTNSVVLNLTNPTHPLADSISNPINAESATINYNITNTDAVNVLEYNNNQIVSYRDVGQGKAILIGFDYYNSNTNLDRFLGNAIRMASNSALASNIITPYTDTIQPGDSSLIKVVYDASNQFAGIYNDTIAVHSNDSANPIIYLPIRFEVLGAPSISTSQQVFNYGSLQVGDSKVDTLIVNNTGCDTLDISSIVATSNNFSASASSLTILPYEEDTLFITFAPTGIQSYSDTLSIFNNDSLVEILLNGVGVGAPVMTVTPNPITVTITDCYDSLLIPVKIKNTGQGPLTGNIISSGSSINSSTTSFYDGFEDGTINKWNKLYTSSFISTTTTNPANGTYALDMAGSNFRELTSILVADTFKSFSIEMKPEVVSNSGTNYCLIGDAVNDLGICYMYHIGNNSYSIVGGSIYNTPISSTAWTKIELRNIDYSNKTFDIYINGILGLSSMSFYNSNTNEISVVTLGTNNSSNRSYFDDVRLGNSFQSASWLSSDSDTVNVAIGDSSTFNLNLQTVGLAPGSYTSQVVVSSNDPLNNFDTILVNLNYIGSPAIGVSDICINYNPTTENTTATDSITIYNFGCDTLDISNITVGNPIFNPLTSVGSIFPGDSMLLRVEFSPTSIGVFSDTLRITTNGVDTVVCLNGTGTGAPAISFNPDPINAIINNCNDSVDVNLTIYNTGLNTLDWKFVNSITATDDFDSGINNSLWDVIIGGVPSASCGVNSGSSALYFNGGGTRTATTNSLNFTNGGVVEFYLKIGNGSSPCETADAGENVVLEYQNTSGFWTIINTYFTGQYNFFTQITENLPAAALSNNTKLRWRQTSFSGSGFDNWSIDDVNISGNGRNEFISYVSLDSSSVLQGDSVNLTVRLNSDGLTSGNYSTYLYYQSNDPSKAFDSLLVNLSYLGRPILNTSSACINYGNVLANGTKTDSLTLYNNGCDTLSLLSVVSLSSVYNVVSFDNSILPGDTGQVIVSFNPTTVGNYNSFIRIFNNDNDTSICLTGDAVAAPVIQASRNNFNVSTPNCDTVNMPFTIRNTGGSNLDYNFNGAVSGGITELLVLTYGVDLTGEYIGTMNALNSYYTNYNQTDLNTTSASVLQAALVNKDVVLIPEVEYGNLSVFSTYSSVLQNYVSNGGTVIFCGSFYGSGQAIFNTGLFSGSLAFSSSSSFTTLNVVNPSHQLANNLTSPFYSQNTTGYYNLTNSNVVDIVTNGSNSVVSYRPIGSGNAILVGFDYFNTNNNTSRVLANAVEFGGTGSLPSWLNIDNPSDSISLGDSLNLTFTFDPRGLANGVYTANLSLNSNDPLNPTVTVACTLNVLNSPCAKIDYFITNNCGGTVQFSDSSSNQPTTWNWDFGDGNSSTISNPNHTYANAGVYNVRLISTNSFGSDTAFQSILINRMDASFTVASPLVTNQAIQFNGVALGAISYFWDFGNGTTSSNQNPATVYQTSGQYIVSLIAVNGVGCSDVARDTLNIIPVGLDETTLNTDYSIYPNPNNGNFFIKSTTGNTIKKVVVFNNVGQVVFERSYKVPTTKEPIQLLKFSKGIYMVKVKLENSDWIEEKISVN